MTATGPVRGLIGNQDGRLLTSAAPDEPGELLWDGFPTARKRLTDAWARHKVSNPVAVTGDWHSILVNDILGDFDDPSAAAATRRCRRGGPSAGVVVLEVQFLLVAGVMAMCWSLVVPSSACWRLTSSDSPVTRPTPVVNRSVPWRAK
jgi:hypothetical protein